MVWYGMVWFGLDVCMIMYVRNDSRKPYVSWFTARLTVVYNMSNYVSLAETKQQLAYWFQRVHSHRPGSDEPQKRRIARIASSLMQPGWKLEHQGASSTQFVFFPKKTVWECSQWPMTVCRGILLLWSTLFFHDPIYIYTIIYIYIYLHTVHEHVYICIHIEIWNIMW